MSEAVSSNNQTGSQVEIEMNTTGTDDDLRGVDLRLAISQCCGLNFEQKVVESGSNTLGAIYFSKHQLQAVARSLGIAEVGDFTKKQLYDRIRDVVGRPNRTRKAFNEDDLRVVCRALGVDLSGISPVTAETLSNQANGGLLQSEYLYRLLDSIRADIFFSANDGARIHWPWRMRPVHEAQPRYVEASDIFIVDSSIQNESIDNEDALAKAAKLKADAVVLADVWHDVEATVDSLVDGVDRYENLQYDGSLVLPLQPPHDRCFEMLMQRGVSNEHLFAIGGLKNSADMKRKIDNARRLRRVAGDDVHLHGLGYDVTDRLAAALADEPELLDSLDTSGPLQDNVSGGSAGGERLSSVAVQAGARLIEDARKLSPHADPDTTTIQQSIGEFK